MKPGASLLTVPLLTALLLTVPLAATPAQAAPGVVRTAVTLRAGPDTGFPAVERIPGGAQVTVHGCLGDARWCDVSFGGERGWIAAAALDTFYGGRYVSLPDYAYAVDVPVVTFAFSAYWDSYYIGRPWFHRHAYWNRFWHAHPHLAAQAPPQQPQGGGARRTGPGMMPAQGAGQAAVERTPAQVAVVPHGGTVGLAATPRMTQQGAGRTGGPPAAMHALMGGMVRAPVGAMSHLAPAGGRGSGGGSRGGSDRRH
jgi:uncharacterized protein YraI